MSSTITASTVPGKRAASAAGASRAVRRLNIAAIGLDSASINRLRAMTNSTIAEVTCIVEEDDEARDRVLSFAPHATVAHSIDEALATDPDGLFIASPNSLHAEHALAAIQSGIAVFCQNPLARNAEDTCRIIDAACCADCLLGVDLPFRHAVSARAVKERIAAGALGDVFAADLAFHSTTGPEHLWWYDPELSGGGCMMDLGAHLIDLALWMLDFPRVQRVEGNLFCQGRRVINPSREAEDYAEATIWLETGTVLQLSCSWNLDVGRDASLAASFHGTRGGASLRNSGPSLDNLAAHHTLRNATRTLFDGPDQFSGRAAVEWAEQLARGELFDPSIHHLRAAARCLDLLYGRATT